MKKFFNFKLGFTLAEVLIVLSIIAVVAVLTIPAVMKNYKYKVYGASLQKTYAQVVDAVSAIMADEMVNQVSQTTMNMQNSCETNKETGPCYFLRNYFKVAADCPGNATFGSKCLASSYSTSRGTLVPRFYGQHCIVTTNGATICMELTQATAKNHLVIDINGPASPNIIGQDTFIAVLNNTTGEINDWLNDATKCGVVSGSDGHIGDYARGCLYKVMMNGWVVTD